MLSIPDWGVTPFAEGRDLQLIAREIDEYNEACRMVTAQYGCNFIDITATQRRNGGDANFLAEDKLHPSALEYGVWARALADRLKQKL